MKNIRRKYTQKLPQTSPEILYLFYLLYTVEIPVIIYAAMDKGIEFIKKLHLRRIKLITEPTLRASLSTLVEKRKSVAELKQIYKRFLNEIQANGDKKRRGDIKLLNWLIKDLPEPEEFTEGILEFLSIDFLIAGGEVGNRWVIVPSKGLLDIFKGFPSDDCTRDICGFSHLLNPDFVNFRIYSREKWIGNIYVLDKYTLNKERILIIDAIQVATWIRYDYTGYIKGILNYFYTFGKKNNYNMVLISSHISNREKVRKLINKELKLKRINIPEKEFKLNRYDMEFESFRFIIDEDHECIKFYKIEKEI